MRDDSAEILYQSFLREAAMRSLEQAGMSTPVDVVYVAFSLRTMAVASPPANQNYHVTVLMLISDDCRLDYRLLGRSQRRESGSMTRWIGKCI